MNQTAYETVIGLEVHLQFNTKSKIFCGCANTFGAEPNTVTCPVCLGLPGSLPVLNQSALEYAIKVALALNCRINPKVRFNRKNYFYPDLPKGYQISQFELPIGEDGYVELPSDTEERKIRIHRAHLEEDAGKLIHDPAQNCSLVDYNRAGTPLMEIVTEPDIRSPEEAYFYLQTLKLLLQYLDVSDCDMEKGSLRCDANISLRPQGDPQLGTKTELKNMNSFKAVRLALEHEEERQTKTLQAGKTIAQETRLWDENLQVTRPMRSKEEAHDYRYFPEPDLMPFHLKPSAIDTLRASLPASPHQTCQRLKSDYDLNAYEAGILIQDRDLVDFFEACMREYSETKKIVNWIIGPLMQETNARKKNLKDLSLSAQAFVDLIKKVENGMISNLVGKDVLKIIIDTGQNPDIIISEQGLAQISDASALEQVIQEVLAENQKTVEQIKAGKQSALGFLVGQTMKKTRGKANPKMVNELLQRRIHNG